MEKPVRPGAPQDLGGLIGNAERELQRRERSMAVVAGQKSAARPDTRVRIVLVGLLLLIVIWVPQLIDVMHKERHRVYATQAALDELQAWSVAGSGDEEE